MPLADVVKPMRQEKPRWLEPPFWVVLTLAILAGVIPARSECLSPSATAGATTTTVYRCPDGDASTGQHPAIVEPGKTTTVERGSADIPWFEPKPTTTADPIVAPKAPAAGKKEDVVKVEPKPEAAPEPTPAKKDVVKVEPLPEEAAAPEAAKPEAVKPTATKAKAKATKTRLTKAKRTKAKVAKRTKAKSEERSKGKLARNKRTKTQAAKAEAKPEQVKTEPAKADDKVVTWTKKDMSIGNRIVNWLGF
ncbi:MAG: hypothetical protein AB7F09_17190 [Parvibaculaceae bacterium]